MIAAIEPGDPTLPPNVDGSTANPRRFYRIFTEGGTDQIRFSNFIDEVLQDFEQSGLAYDNDRILMWDNLQSHLTPLVYQTVQGCPSPNRSLEFVI